MLLVSLAHVMNLLASTVTAATAFQQQLLLKMLSLLRGTEIRSPFEKSLSTGSDEGTVSFRTLKSDLT